MCKQLSRPKQTREFLSNLFSEWWPLSFPRFMKKANKLIANVEKFHNKLESRILACQSRSKSIPKNATIRKEFVRNLNVVADNMATITMHIGKILKLKD